MSNFEINIGDGASKVSEKLKGKGKYFLILVIILVAMPFIRGLLFSWKVIEPGYTGIKITTALYYTPSGRSIQVTGVEPDIVVDDTPGGNLFRFLRT